MLLFSSEATLFHFSYKITALMGEASLCTLCSLWLKSRVRGKGC